MIPDDTSIFNTVGPRSNFDDHEVRLQHLLGQDAMPTSEGGRHLLYGCPVCKSPWYKAGRQEHPRLTPAQLARLGTVLHADIHALYQLPRALCPICSTVHLGGMFSVGEYSHPKGYHFLWESASPRSIQLLAIVCRSEELTVDTLLQTSPDTFAGPIHGLHAVLAWLETCPFPGSIRAYTDEQSQHFTRRFPPGNAVDEKARHWHGYAWDTSCPPLGGDVLVSLAVTLPPLAPSPIASLLMGWRVLARAMRMVL